MEDITVTPNLANATPLRQFDWMAYRDPEKTLYGYGRTAEEALADFKLMEDENYCWHHCPAERRDGEDCSLNGGCPLNRKE